MEACAQTLCSLGEIATLGCIRLGRCKGADGRTGPRKRRKGNVRGRDELIGVIEPTAGLHLVSLTVGERQEPPAMRMTRCTSSKVSPDGAILLVRRCVRPRQYLSQQIIDVQATLGAILPLPRVAQTDLLEACVVSPVCSPNVNVAADDNLRVELVVPVLGLLSAAPQTEARHIGQADQIFTELPVVYDDQPLVWMCCNGGCELRFCARDECMAPFDARPIRVWVQQMLISRLNIQLPCPLERVFQLDVVRAEAVVVEGEDGRHDDGPSLALPQRIVILGRQYAVLARNIYALHVLGVPSLTVVFLRRHCVQFMVARHPPHLSEALLRLCKCGATMLGRLAHVASQYKVIVGVRQQLLESFAVALEREVDVADGEEAARHDGWRGGRRG
jgi:hypothetical protein